MKRGLIVCLTLALVVCTAPVSAQERLKISSTTSTDNSGLFGAMNPPFEKRFNCRVDVNRRDVMYNDFVIIGPTEDPAGIRGLKDAKKALASIAAKEALFISRGDDSGTHKKEKQLWKKTGIDPKGKWYAESGQGMGAVIQIANEKIAYTLADRGTYLSFSKKIDLMVLCEGDNDLFNPYGIMAVNPAKVPSANYVLSMAYIGWVTSQEGQKIIREFGMKKFGQPLFIPQAIP